mmetsp:Transcript_4197/g.10939  ORF Transcript_4197/g.10939 Transcript_4197/m.10939 type:complete len:230 (+) Transcript_4197:453-1142(+)
MRHALLSTCGILNGVAVSLLLDNFRHLRISIATICAGRRCRRWVWACAHLEIIANIVVTVQIIRTHFCRCCCMRLRHDVGIVQCTPRHLIHTIALARRPPRQREDGDALSVGLHPANDAIQEGREAAQERHERIQPPNVAVILNNNGVNEQGHREDRADQRADAVLVQARRLQLVRVVEFEDAQSAEHYHAEAGNDDHVLQLVLWLCLSCRKVIRRCAEHSQPQENEHE